MIPVSPEKGTSRVPREVHLNMEQCSVSALDRPAAELTVVDVYDIAVQLGQEFERVIDRYGCEVLVGVVPKVVRVLELLEALVNYGGGRHKSDELQRELDRLRQERSDGYRQDRRHHRELELVDDVWRSEVQDLLSQISELQKENRRLLLLSQSVCEPPVCEEQPLEHEEVSEKEREVLERLMEMVEKQRDEIRTKEDELTLRSHDIEALQLQQNHLMKVNQDLRHRLTLLETQGKGLVQQRAELEAVFHAQLHELQSLKQEVSRLQRELQDMDLDRLGHDHESSGLSTSPSSSTTASVSLTVAIPASRAEDKPTSVWEECAEDPEFLANCFEQEPLTITDCKKDDSACLLLDRSSSEPEEDMDSDGQDSPRFTLQELRDVLHERNHLKAQVFLLQEELAYYSTNECEDDSILSEHDSCPEEGVAAPAAAEPESGIRRLIFTAIMPMVAAGLISDDPTLMPIRRLVFI